MISGIQNFNILKPKNNGTELNSLSYAKRISISTPNFDTVSFTSSAMMPPKTKKCAPDIADCEFYSMCAEPARFYLENVLDEYLGPLKDGDNEENPNERKFPVFKYTTRIKSAQSIKEKVASRYYKICTGESEKFAKQVFEELNKYVHKNPEKTDEEILETINRTTEYSGTPDVMSPYKDAEFYLNSIIDLFESEDYYDFSEVDEKKKKIIIENILDVLKDSTPTDTINGNKYVDPAEKSSIKFYAQDIVGARIVMNESKPEYSNEVIEALKKAVTDGKIKIKSIENNIPEQGKLPIDKSVSDYAYASEKQLSSLAKTSGVKLENNTPKSGYMAIHINIDLTNPMFGKYGEEYNGYGGEIQILGKNVEQLKELEDLCYKLKGNKNIIHTAYAPFKENFLKHYKGDKVKKAFEDYTYAAYLHQREILPGKNSNNFLSIDKAGFTDVLPQYLDFNYLKLLKKQCDATYKIQTDKAKDKPKKNFNRNLIAEIQRKQEISTIKKDIAYQMRHND